MSGHIDRSASAPRPRNRCSIEIDPDSHSRYSDWRGEKSLVLKPNFDKGRAAGKTDREIHRCLKRYIAREAFSVLERPLDTL